MSKLMVSVSGVRGIFGDTLTPDNVLNYAAHFGIFSHCGKIYVGRDSRTTGIAMFNAVSAGLMSVGCDVVDCGIVSTPTLLLCVQNDAEAAGGICITASHNPAPWNALKFVAANGMFLFPENSASFIESLSGTPAWKAYDAIGSLSAYAQATADHIRAILNIPYLELDKIKKAHYKVVIDSVNGAGGLISPLLLRQLGCKVIELNSEPNGLFAHSPEPLNENLSQLCTAVIEHKADIGFATDPDVDRLSIVDESGNCLSEEFSLLLAANFILPKNAGTLVTNLSSSMAAEDIAARYGCSVIRTRIGEINVAQKMQELHSPIGGEGNGGIICPEVHYTRDAPAGMAIILAAMAQSCLKISSLAKDIPRYHFCKDKILLSSTQLDAVMQNAENLAARSNTDRTDGIKILGDKYWIHIRKSGTEPIVRLYIESDSPQRSSELCQTTKNLLLKDIL